MYLFHAIERIKKWGITEEMVAEALLLSEEVIVGHRNRYIAHRRYGNHLVRAVYVYEEELPALITVYFPYQDRYFKGGGVYEDKIFKGSDVSTTMIYTHALNQGGQGVCSPADRLGLGGL